MSSLLQQQITDNLPFMNNTLAIDASALLNDKVPYSKSVAQHLQDTRVEAGLSLTDIAHTLRISQHYLQAIEDCNLDVMPERVYTLGFIRSYAKYLGLNGEEIVKRFKNEIMGEEIPNTTYVATRLNEESSLPSRTLIYAITALLVLGSIGSWLYSHVFFIPDSQPTAMPTVIKNEIDQSLMTEALPSTMAVQDTATVAPIREINSVNNTVNNPVDNKIETVNQHEISAATSTSSTEMINAHNGIVTNTIKLVFTELSWIEIKDAHGKIMLSKDMNPGESYDITPQEGMRFSTGNAGGITVKQADQADFIMGKHGEIIKNIALDSERFRKL